MPLTQENLRAISKGHNKQAGPRTHKSSRSNPKIERNPHNGIQTLKSTDKNHEAEAASSKRSHSRTGRIKPLCSAASDPGLDSEYVSQRSDMNSSNPGRRSSIASSMSRYSDTSSLDRSRDSFHVNVGHHDVHVRYGSGRTNSATSSDDGNETLVHGKIKKAKERSRSKRTAGMVV
ncbi:uncharacterized protein EAF01_000238 [Botrytis porri]|uniref:Uncharacterized protein n=1 Tax=Botrytis porri TaxID=87229 RepID=A0A4Z1L234_9HELO|nr:uncharacterized protein EAF01_000238 [Botrytis porri]KAF7913832.1 hypothetical protein EAF01_000238 [Botrytis porri]TGO90841.1 hypothetical protein BPOR_0049g00210 [Botrytis porri]